METHHWVRPNPMVKVVHFSNLDWGKSRAIFFRHPSIFGFRKQRYFLLIIPVMTFQVRFLVVVASRVFFKGGYLVPRGCPTILWLLGFHQI